MLVVARKIKGSPTVTLTSPTISESVTITTCCNFEDPDKVCYRNMKNCMNMIVD